MKVGTKLAIAGALALTPLVGGLALAVTQVQSLAAQSAITAERQHHAARLALEILRGLELVSEYRSKLEVTGDEGYRTRLRQTEVQLERWFSELDRSELTTAERKATAALAHAVREERRLPIGSVPELSAREAAKGLLEASRRALDDHAHWVEAQSRQTARAAIGGGLIAVLLSAISTWLLVRTLNRPLRQLIRGTRAVATGDFEFRARPLANDEFGEVTESFNQMVDSLGEFERLKAELVSRVSHELRTPLVAMIETNRLLLEEIPGPINTKQRRMLTLHAGAAERLTAMIDDLLDLSALEASDSLEPRSIDLVELTRDAVDQMSPLAREKEIELDVGFSADSAIARGDARRYQQVVQNLLGNALKHSPTGGVVHVGLGLCGADALPEPVATTEGKQYALLRVEDEGPGVEPEDRARIFDKFVQTRRARQGVGLGLAICRQIVLAHGGRVGVADSALGGAAFFATFPLARDERAG